MIEVMLEEGTLNWTVSAVLCVKLKPVTVEPPVIVKIRRREGRHRSHCLL